MKRTMTRCCPTHLLPRLTRLGRFLQSHPLDLAELAAVAGTSEQYLLRLRYGRSEPTRRMMVCLTLACRRLVAGRPDVRIAELFDLGDGNIDGGVLGACRADSNEKDPCR